MGVPWLRGGVGVFYDLGTGSTVRGYSGFPFNSNRVTPGQTFPASAAALEPAPFNSSAPYSSQFYTFDPQLQLPYTLQWNATIERALGSHQSVTVSYVASAGRRLLRNDGYANRLIAGQQITLLNPAVFTNAATVFYTYNGSDSAYRSLQMQYQRRLSRGLQALASYTWALSEDTASDEASATLIPGGVSQFLVDPRQDFGPSDFDVRHNALASLTYDIPAPGSSRPLRAVLGGWGVDGIVRARIGITALGHHTRRRPAESDDPAPGGHRERAGAVAGRSARACRTTAQSSGLCGPSARPPGHAWTQFASEFPRVAGRSLASPALHAAGRRPAGSSR